MDKPKLYRKRIIPNETVLLKDDEIVYMEKDVIITKWRVLKPRKDFSHGVSCYHIDKGFKISKMINSEGKCIYRYCDIIDTTFDADKNTYIFEDLLIDVVLYEDGSVKVLDLDEIAHALEDNSITVEKAQKALLIADKLLKIIYSGCFDELTELIKDY